MTAPGKLITPWFVVRQEGGEWVFVNKQEWEQSGAPIKGERRGERMHIWDSIISAERSYIITDQQLLDLGYRLPAWKCACGFTKDLKPNFCPECGVKLK